jgi:hypothetical protein
VIFRDVREDQVLHDLFASNGAGSIPVAKVYRVHLETQSRFTVDFQAQETLSHRIRRTLHDQLPSAFSRTCDKTIFHSRFLSTVTHQIVRQRGRLLCEPVGPPRANEAHAPPTRNRVTAVDQSLRRRGNLRRPPPRQAGLGVQLGDGQTTHAAPSRDPQGGEDASLDGRGARASARHHGSPHNFRRPSCNVAIAASTAAGLVIETV